ncbi:hypothetical protein, partial [Fulvivirga sp.]
SLKGMQTRWYEVSKLDAQAKNKRYKDFYDEQPKVLVSPENFSLEGVEGSFASWKTFGNWFYNLNNNPFELSTETKVYLSSLDRSDKKELIKNIYHYMQDKTRYISIQLGIGGFKSLPTSEVDSYGFGDCKALTTYMKNMLSYTGINSNYILVKAGSDTPDIDKDFPSNQFNHVYLGIPLLSDTVFLECTSQSTPAFYTGKFTDDRYVLWIEKDRSKIIRSTIYDESENLKVNTAEIELNSDGNAKMNVKTTNEGIFYDEIMVYNSAQQDYIKKVNQAKFHHKDFSIDGFEYKQFTRDSICFTSFFDVSINGLGKIVGDRMILPVNMMTPLDELIDVNSAMKYASITRAFTVVDSVKIKLPKDRWIYNLPEAVNVESKFGSYSLDLSHESNYLIINRKVIFNKGDFTKDQFQEFEEYFNEIEKVDNKKLVVNSKT